MAALFAVWMQVNSSQRKKADIEQQHKDSLVIATKQKFIADSIKAVQLVTGISKDTITSAPQDSSTTPIAANTPEQTKTIETPLMSVTVTNKGAKIKEIFLKNFKTSREDEKGKEVRDPLKLQENPANSMEFQIPLANGTIINTSILPSETTSEDNMIYTRTQLPNKAVLQQSYKLDPKDYLINYEAKIIGNPGIAASKPIMLKWVNHLSKLEKNHKYEKTYSTLYYKSPEETSDYVSYTKDATVKIEKERKTENT